MEQKGLLISALSVGVGVGVGLGLASGQTKWGANAFATNAITPEKIEHEMLRLVVDGRESNVTFDNFPYYLRYFTFLHFSPFIFLISNVTGIIFNYYFIKLYY